MPSPRPLSLFSGPIWLRLLRWGVLAAACLFLYTHLSAGQGTALLGAFRMLGQDHAAVLLLIVVLLLVPLNWGLEAVKWRTLVWTVQPLTWWRAFVATLAGTGIALITPNRTGEFVGRVLYLEPGHRIAGSLATALGSIAQFVITLVAGVTAMGVYTAMGLPFPWVAAGYTAALLSLAALVAAGALVFYFFPRLLRQLLLIVPVLRRWERSMAVLEQAERSTLWRVLLLSSLRYAVFTLQFALLCRAFHVGVPLATILLAVPVIYLITTLIPTMLISELGVRGSVALAVLVPLGANATGVLAATGTLWLLNLVLPAAVGSLLLITSRIRTAP